MFLSCCEKLVLSSFLSVAHMKKVCRLSRRMLPLSLDNVSNESNHGMKMQAELRWLVQQDAWVLTGHPGRWAVYSISRLLVLSVISTLVPFSTITNVYLIIKYTN